MMERNLLNSTGEPDAEKLARPVRRGAVGKVLLDSNSLAAYPTLARARQFWHTCPLLKFCSSVGLRPSGHGAGLAAEPRR